LHFIIPPAFRSAFIIVDVFALNGTLYMFHNIQIYWYFQLSNGFRASFSGFLQYNVIYFVIYDVNYIFVTTKLISQNEKTILSKDAIIGVLPSGILHLQKGEQCPKRCLERSPRVVHQNN
jgi:hypothetical protein